MDNMIFMGIVFNHFQDYKISVCLKLWYQPHFLAICMGELTINHQNWRNPMPRQKPNGNVLAAKIQPEVTTSDTADISELFRGWEARPISCRD
jgi:hypothetical protein